MYKFAVICASNQNRSMEAHQVLSRKGFDIRSYGTNSMVKVPGPSADRPNAYPFGTSYDHIYKDLAQKDSKLYTQNGLLMLLDRNRKIKEAPQRFQEAQEAFDIIITCEERCFDLVTADLMQRGVRLNKAVHVINFDIKDASEDATIGARAILQLAQQLASCADLHGQAEEIIGDFVKEKATHPLMYAVHFY